MEFDVLARDWIAQSGARWAVRRRHLGSISSDSRDICAADLVERFALHDTHLATFRLAAPKLNAYLVELVPNDERAGRVTTSTGLLVTSGTSPTSETWSPAPGRDGEQQVVWIESGIGAVFASEDHEDLLALQGNREKLERTTERLLLERHLTVSGVHMFSAGSGGHLAWLHGRGAAPDALYLDFEPFRA